jgi:hypothetical protein
MKTNQSKHWSIGCKIVQWRINTQIHQTLKDTPYHLTYGQHPRVGISNLPVSPAILENLATAAQLQDVYLSMNSSFNEIEGSAAESSSLSLGKRKERSPQDSSKRTGEARDAKRIALKEALLSTTTEEVPHVDISSPSDKKAAEEDVHPYVCWLELIDERADPVDLDEMSRARVNSVFPIIYCTNNKNITDDSNWAPCILRKVRKEEYEVLDRQEQDKIEDLDWEGNDGLSASWSMYYKYPTKSYVNFFQVELENAINDKIAHKISPRHLSLCKQVTANVQNKRANKVAAKAVKKSPGLVFKMGDVVLIQLDNVDCTKVDGAKLVGVIVSMNKDKSKCRVAVKQGLLHQAYVYHCLKPVPETSNNLDVMDLQNAYKNWRLLPNITEREAVCYISLVGGQGMKK